MSERVSVAIHDHVAEVELRRPDKFNALDLEMFQALAGIASKLRGDSTVRAVVLHGAGDNFCAGIDLDMLQGGGEDAMRALLAPVQGSPANLAQQAAFGWRQLPMPVICALQGIAYGGGLQIAMGADIRYAAPNTQMSIMEIKWGLIPDMAISTTLRHLVAPDRIKELAWTARVFDADEAERLGLVTRIEADPLAAARATAASIAGRSPDAVRGIKRLVNEAWNLSDEASLALEAHIQAAVLKSPNQAEAVRANLEKRAPEFDD